MSIINVDRFIDTRDNDDAIGINRAIESLPEVFNRGQPRGHTGIVEFNPGRKYITRSPIRLSGRTMLCSSHPTARAVIHADTESAESAFGTWMVEGEYSNDVDKRANGNFGCGLERINFFANGKFENAVQIGMSKNGGGIKSVGVFHPAAGGIGFNLLRSSDAVEIHDLMIESYAGIVGSGGIGFKCDVAYCINAFVEVTGYHIGFDLLYPDAFNLTANVEACPLPLRAIMPTATTITMGAGPAGRTLAEIHYHKNQSKKDFNLHWSKNRDSEYEHIKMVEVKQGLVPTGKVVLVPIYQGPIGTGDGLFSIADFYKSLAQ